MGSSWQQKGNNMIELKAKDLTIGGTFYFHTMQDCNDFLYVFKDHWCNVPWEKPREVPNDFPISKNQRKSMDKSPKERAESNLSWGFDHTKWLEIDLNEKQNSFVKSMVEKFS